VFDQAVRNSTLDAHYVVPIGGKAPITHTPYSHAVLTPKSKGPFRKGSKRRPRAIAAREKSLNST